MSSGAGPIVGLLLWPRRGRRRRLTTEGMKMVIVAVMLVGMSAADDYRHHTFISPNSADLHINNEAAELSETLTSAPRHVTSDDQTVILSSAPDIPENESPYHSRVLRSADPILTKSVNYNNEGYEIYKNVGESLESNDVELSGRVPKFINPSRTDDTEDSEIGILPTSSALSGSSPSSPSSGEGNGAPPQLIPDQQAMAAEPQQTSIQPTAMTIIQMATAIPSDQPSSSPTSLQQQQLKPTVDRPRQANPDIQDIITGIVKLLNGNVNVQANTAPAMGRPLRPLSTRINNRGPPRISDVPPLPPDFDVPAGSLPMHQKQSHPTRMPTPYPFDLPNQDTSPVRPYINGVPLPEQIIPITSMRPSFYRPVTITPWNRPPPRRPYPHRRPPTLIPNYQPPIQPEESISITSERPMEDILTLHFGPDLEFPYSDTNHEDKTEEVEADASTEEEAISSDSLETTTANVMDKEFERNKEKSSLKMDKHPNTSSISSSSSSTEVEDEVNILPTLSSIKTSTTIIDPLEMQFTSPTINKTVDFKTTIAPTSVVQEIRTSQIELINTTTIETDNDSLLSRLEGLGEATPVLESSIQEVLQTLKADLLEASSASNVPTEALPQIIPSTIAGTVESTTFDREGNQSNQGFPYYPYRPRPGIVLDDTEYKPGGSGTGLNRIPIVTARPPLGQLGEIFDITVSAIQGPIGSSAGHGKPYVIPVDIENVHGSNQDVITSPFGNEGFVSIDGKRTYLNLFGEATAEPSIAPSPPSANTIKGTLYSVAENEKPKPEIVNGIKPTVRRPVFGRRPSQPPVRIDTCIVGDDSTCDSSQHESCRTDQGVSSCHCRPSYARRKLRDPCRKVVSVLVSIRVDKLYERRIVWASELSNKASDSYLQLSYETERALDSAMSMTPFSDEFLGAKVNRIYKGEKALGLAGVFVNLTLQLEENGDTARPTIRGEIQRHLLGVIQRRNNNIGNSALWVESPPGSVSSLQDLDECSSPELHDCHVLASCRNTFGSFTCICNEGYRDPWSDNKHRAGRHCEQCPSQYCNNRGECKYQNGQQICTCAGNYYGTQCELDGEVLGVAIGASVAAIIIIGLTLVCLVMWSRRWSREQKAAIGSPVFGYMATASNTVKTPAIGGPPYQMTLEDRLRWAQIADAMAQTNHYAPEPVLNNCTTRPSSAVFGYPTSLSIAGTLPHHHHHGGTLPPIPLPRLNLPQPGQMGGGLMGAGRAASIHGMRPLENSSSSEEEDKIDLLGRGFQVPRPKSRSNASIANQSGIYYDVDYDQNDIYKHPGSGIPMSTYTAGRHPFYRN